MDATEVRAARRPATALGFALRAFLPLALGYLLSYFFRSVNAIIAPDLLRDLDIGAEQLGLLTSIYFLAFAAMQLPLGVLLDRFGPRRVQAVLLTAAAGGAFLFGLAENLAVLAVARGLIGLGVAGALMSAFMGFVNWFPVHRLALANGLFMTFGGLGALLATGPVEAFLAIAPWRALFLTLGGVTLLVAALILLFTPDLPRDRPLQRLSSLLAGIAQVFGDRVFWRVAPFTAATLGSAFALQSLWAGPWLSDVALLSRPEVAAGLSSMALGLIVGSGCMGLVVSIGQRFGLSALGVFVVLGVVYLAIVAAMVLRMTGPAILLWTGLGFLTNILSLSYVVLSQHFPAALAGRVNTAINLVVTSTSFAVQYLVGWVVDFWPQQEDGRYSPEAYSAGFSVVLGLGALTLLWFILLVSRQRWSEAS